VATLVPRQWTQEQIVALAISFEPYRAEVLLACGPHDVSALPLTADSRLPYCLLCFSLFDLSGTVLNPPPLGETRVD